MVAPRDGLPVEKSNKRDLLHEYEQNYSVDFSLHSGAKSDELDSVMRLA